MSGAASAPVWLTGELGAWRIAVWVQPGAAHTGAAGVQDGCLKLRIAARPVEGAANEALIVHLELRIEKLKRELY
ncbi:MAG TPA: DUF167 domain-containing protein, partial [Burkholderiaceae bacterium]|nr:DUF167 domain-containing protein [Burkholderiaceae bacterium]